MGDPVCLLPIDGQGPLPIGELANGSRLEKPPLPMPIERQESVSIDAQCSLPMPVEDRFF